MRVSEHVAWLKVNGLNPILVMAGGENILVDACLPGQFALLKAAIQAEGVPIETLTKLVFTHQDMDHIGCVNELLSAAPGLKVYAHESETPYLDGTQTPVKLAARLEKLEEMSQSEREGVLKMKEGYAARKISFERGLKDGEGFPEAAGFRLVHTPGHTPGHACAYVAGDKLLMTGDAMNLGAGGELQGPNPVYTKDMVLAQESLKKLQGLEIKTLICYHGGLLEGEFQPELKKILA
ncbi:MAG: MBL fold metallo-hydrolase [Christensenellaceae bacterium]|jgi:glyoxylase-like metal-dependent hydrolase (beta-lactamase superfamily II)|nr:MBL fold metallo-hydrolase [Christensenellaceae bacterium]